MNRKTSTVGAVQQVPIANLRPFNHHSFKIYEGKKMENLVQSIRENGIIHPPCVRQIDNSKELEIISGHNRVRAAELAGLTEIAVVVRELTDDEAIILSNESNIAQRTFDDWLHSEKATSIFQYHEVIKRQGERSDIISTSTSGEVDQKFKVGSARQITARAYGVSDYTIRLNLELYRLVKALMQRLDDKEFGTGPARNLSFIPAEVQELINEVLVEDRDICNVSITASSVLRKELQACSFGNLGNEEKEELKGKIREILSCEVDVPELQKPQSDFMQVKLPIIKYIEFFADTEADDVVQEILAAVEYYRKDVAPVIQLESQKG